jgi:hypothetical protein
MDEEIVSKITKEIKQSGFPLEIYCLNICSKKNTGRMPNIRYSYEGNLREIDLYAFFEEINLDPREGENLQYTSTSIVVECKKSKYPWVFFSSNMYGSEDVFCFAKYYSDFDLYFAGINAPNLRTQIYRKLRKNHYKYNKGVPYCLSYFEAFRKPDAPSEIYKAIESVLSFLNFRIESRKSRALEKRGYFTEFFCPVVVLEGSLFEAEIEEDEIYVKKTDHIHLRVDYKDDIYMVDVVTKENFENLFNMIENDHYDFVESINGINFSQDYQSSLKRHRRKILDR